MSSTDTDTDTAPLQLTREDGLVVLTLNRPQALNAFDSALAQDLLDALQEAGADPSVRAVLITGAGRAFSAGADIKSQFTSEDAKSVIEAEMRKITSPTILAIREMPKPVIAAVNGPAAGVGCSIALACDQIVAAEGAYFLLAFANIGLTVDGGASLLVAARIGLTRALRMGLLAERVPAADALSWGLIDQVAPAEELIPQATALAQRFASGPTRSYAATKQSINAALLPGLADALDLEAKLQGQLANSADFAEGATAFAERRPANFRGE